MPEDMKMDPVIEDIKTGLAGIEERLTQQVIKRDQAIAEGDAAAKKAALDAISNLDTEMKQAIKDVQGELKSLDAAMGRMRSGAQEVKAPSQLVVEDERFQNAKANGFRGTANQQIPVPVHRKTLFTGATLGSTPAYTYPVGNLPGYFTEPERDIHVRDLLAVAPAPSAAVEYVRRTGNRWIADVQSAEGAEKEEQALTFEVVQETAKTIAHYIPVSKQILNDDSQLRSYIDNELGYGLRLKEDQQLLYGTGLSGQITGLMIDTGVQEYDAADGPATDTPADVLRRAMTRLRNLYFRPSGIVLNPFDWEEIELTKDGEERYIWFFGPQGIAGPSLWRLPVIDTPAIQQGEYLVGDFRIGATLWEHENPSVSVGWVNDQFVKNTLTILGEERILFSRQLPRAFVRGDLGTGS